jgi:hypothetical protein
MYGCGRSSAENIDPYTDYLFYGSMNELIYADASDIHACADNYHFKEGTRKFDECMKAVS